MAINIPTTAQQAADNLSRFEGQLGQTSPINDKSFLRVLAYLEAGQFTTLYKFGAQQILQVLAITAIGSGLDTIGAQYNLPRKAAEAAAFTISLPATAGTVIPITRSFVGNSNGIRYSIDAPATASGTPSLATIQVTSQTLGAAGNLNVGETMTIDTPVAGSDSSATITTQTNTGADRESDDDYRPRLLTIIRSTPGGGNSADYRIWAEEVAGVVRAYPFAGKPIGSSLSSAPPDRTVYVEATTAIDPDGIAPQSLLDEVRASITADPDTGEARQPLGLTDDTLFVETIVRTTFFVTVTGLVVDANVISSVRADIESALDTYFRSVSPYVDGLDSPLDRNDVLTDPSVAEIVQDVVRSVGGSVSGVAFDVTEGTSISRYQLANNELGKLGAVAYV